MRCAAWASWCPYFRNILSAVAVEDWRFAGARTGVPCQGRSSHARVFVQNATSVASCRHATEAWTLRHARQPPPLTAKFPQVSRLPFTTSDCIPCRPTLAFLQSRPPPPRQACRCRRRGPLRDRSRPARRPLSALKDDVKLLSPTMPSALARERAVFVDVVVAVDVADRTVRMDAHRAGRARPEHGDSAGRAQAGSQKSTTRYAANR